MCGWKTTGSITGVEISDDGRLLLIIYDDEPHPKIMNILPGNLPPDEKASPSAGKAVEDEKSDSEGDVPPQFPIVRPISSAGQDDEDDDSSSLSEMTVYRFDPASKSLELQCSTLEFLHTSFQILIFGISYFYCTNYILPRFERFDELPRRVWTRHRLASYFSNL